MVFSEFSNKLVTKYFILFTKQEVILFESCLNETWVDKIHTTWESRSSLVLHRFGHEDFFLPLGTHTVVKESSLIIIYLVET